MRTILFVGGGSVGHIAPCVAVWRAIQGLDSKYAAHFVCADRADDRAFLEGEKLEYTPINAPKLSPSFPWRFAQALLQAARIFRNESPMVVFSKGGFVSVPVCMIAAWKRIPIVLHESDAVSGRANAFVGRFAKWICLGFPRIPLGPKDVVTGNPLRSEVTTGDPARGQEITTFDGSRPVLLVMGGSQGARTINEAILQLLPTLTQTFDVVHLTGAGKGQPTQETHYWSRPFAQEELPHLYAIADVAVSRAGAGSIAELAANRIATVLVPLRGVGHDHQQCNAEAVERAQGCIVLQQEHLPERLVEVLQGLQAARDMRESMTKRFSSFAHMDAATKIAAVLLDVIANSRGKS